MEIKSSIEAIEVAELLRDVINKNISIKLCDPCFTWEEANGNIGVKINGYTITIFNDSGELDYIDSAISPDGREGDFDYWTEHASERKDPVDLLTEEEQSKLELKLNEAT